MASLRTSESCAVPKYKSAIEGFEEGYIPELNSGCWLWLKALNTIGYGVFGCGGYKGYAHRYSYSYFKKKPIPKGMHVCHSCDMPCCVNPDHLWLGSRSDNMRDCKRKRRHASDKVTTNYARADRGSAAKLTWEQVREIRDNPDKLTQRKLAARYGVVQSTIFQILQGNHWKGK